MKAVHIQDLRQRVKPILAVHIQELRNRLVANWNSSPSSQADGHASLSYDPATNRITSSGFAYDKAGNQVRALIAGGASQRFQYDAANRLVKVKADDNITVIASYTYGDSNEWLVAQEGSLRTYYACGGKAEYVESGGSTTPQWSKSYIHLGARLLSTLTPNGSGGEAIQHHHPDRLGTRLVTNAQDTTYFEQVTLPFGTALNAESTGSTNRRFTSYDRSSTTGLDYAINRHYDPQQGRFTQVDPIGMGSVELDNPQTLNLYAYCANDPVNSVDPSGLGFFSFFKKLFKGIWKVLSSKWFAIAVAVALAVISIGVSLHLLVLSKTLTLPLGIDLGFGAAASTYTVTQLTALGWIAAGLSVTAAIPALTSMQGILSTLAGFGVGQLSGNLHLGTGIGGTPDWNPEITELQAPRRRRGRTGFATPAQAAIAALSGINRRSRRENREYGGAICETGGRFISTPPRRGGAAGVNIAPCPTGTTNAGWYHTHAAYDPRYLNEVFSPADIGISNRRGTGWLATPSRRIRVYDPATGTTTTLRRRTP